MSRKFRVWLDSGANCHSCYEQEIYLEEIGVEDDEWDNMSDEKKDEVMREVAWDRMDWGYSEEE